MSIHFPDSSWVFNVNHSARSDIGMRRASNQDSHLEIVAVEGHDWLASGHLFLVADGMGAHAAGEVASQLAVNTIAKSYHHRGDGELVIAALHRAITEAHLELRRRSDQNEAYRDMGTTLSALLLLPQGATLAHVGDSRIYRLRNRVLEQLTFDHSVVWEICVTRRIPFNKPPLDIPKNQITRSLGPSPQLKIDQEGVFPVEIGDKYLLCSDGLSGLVEDLEIAHVMNLFPPDIATETLINLANLGGGHDNITATIIETTPLSEEERRIVFRRRAFRWNNIMLLPILLSIAVAVLFLLGNLLLAMILAPVVILSIMLMLMTWFGVEWRPWQSSHFFPALPLGRAPYTRTECDSGEAFSQKLASIMRELYEAAKTHHPNQMTEIDAHRTCGEKTFKQRAYHDSSREFCLAINATMTLLKKTPRA